MIQELKVKNFLSFKDEVVLSFEATRDTNLEDNYVVEVAPGVRLLRFAMVMGANGSGKSNLLKALEFLRHWWFDRPDDDDELTGVDPFMLDRDTMKEPTELELRFWIDETKYCYILKLDSERVYQERLNMYKSVQPTLVFNRELVNGHTEITFNSTVEKISDVAKEKLELECLNNMSVIAATKKVNLPLTTLETVRDWMRKSIKPIIEPEIRMYEWAVGEMKENPKVKDHIIKFLHTSDFNICDIQRTETVTDIPEQILNMMINAPGLPKDEKERIKNEKTITSVDVNFIHKVENHRGIEEYPINEDAQSYGTRRLVGMESAIYEATKDGAFLNIDEFEASMHHDLALYVLSKFLVQDGHSQMLVTTHCTPLLGWTDKLIRKDSVWFTERGADGSSNLYTLVEFKGLNRMSSIQNAYMKGTFGAVPNITINNYYFQHQNNNVNQIENNNAND